MLAFIKLDLMKFDLLDTWHNIEFKMFSRICGQIFLLTLHWLNQIRFRQFDNKCPKKIYKLYKHKE